MLTGRKWPISKINLKDDVGWIFVKETEECSFTCAMIIAVELQDKDPDYLYRVWDCR